MPPQPARAECIGRVYARRPGRRYHQIMAKTQAPPGFDPATERHIFGELGLASVDEYRG